MPSPVTRLIFSLPASFAYARVSQIFHAIHQAYLLAISNPFHPSPPPPANPATASPPARDPKAFESSKRLDRRITEIVGSLGIKG